MDPYHAKVENIVSS